MKINANLHFHAAEDPRHGIRYSVPDALRFASEIGLGALALTFHNTFTPAEQYAKEAEMAGVMLISGIEIDMCEKERPRRRNHVIVLNGEKSVERVKTFDDLARYKKEHPNVFVLAPHPFFYGNFSLGERLGRYLHLFDVVEHSWFYSKTFNRNERAETLVREVGLPFIATSDTHILRRLADDYVELNVSDLSPQHIFQAIREGQYRNVTKEKRLLRDMCATVVLMKLHNVFFKRSNHRAFRLQ